MQTATKLKLYELVNPSDPYTFRAPNIQVAGAAVALLSTSFGATCLEDGDDETTPILFGWKEWCDSHGIDGPWIKAHKEEIADALDSFLIGGKNERADVETMLAELPEEKREEWRAKRQDRHRSSMNRIGEAAYRLAKRIREH